MRSITVHSLRRRHRKETAYVVKCIKSPDKGSVFEKNTRRIRWLPGFVLIWLLKRAKYGGVLFIDELNKDIIGHIFYRICVDEFRIFSIFVDEKFRGRKYSCKFVKATLELSHKLGCTRAMIGAGNDSATTHLWQKVLKGEIKLSFKVKKGAKVGSVIYVD